MKHETSPDLDPNPKERQVVHVVNTPLPIAAEMLSGKCFAVAMTMNAVEESFQQNNNTQEL